MTMVKCLKYGLFLISILLIVSCSNRMVASRQNSNYVPYSEILSIKKITLNNSSLRSIISDFISETTTFENGVNSYSPYPIDYFITVGSFCRNDSSFIVLKATAGSYMFYGHTNDIDKRILEQFRLAEVERSNVLVARDIKESFCNDKGGFYTDSMDIEEFELNWYKNRNGDRLIDFHPYFFRIYYFNGEKIESVEYVFPDRIQELK